METPDRYPDGVDKARTWINSTPPANKSTSETPSLLNYKLRLIGLPDGGTFPTIAGALHLIHGTILFSPT